jgi:hypothetical protein
MCAWTSRSFVDVEVLAGADEPTSEARVAAPAAVFVTLPVCYRTLSHPLRTLTSTASRRMIRKSYRFQRESAPVASASAQKRSVSGSKPCPECTR